MPDPKYKYEQLEAERLAKLLAKVLTSMHNTTIDHRYIFQLAGGKVETPILATMIVLRNHYIEDFHR